MIRFLVIIVAANTMLAQHQVISIHPADSAVTCPYHKQLHLMGTHSGSKIDFEE